MTGAEFRPAQPVRPVWDSTLGQHVLLFGTWHNAAGAVVGMEVCTLVQTRRPDQVREVLTPHAVSVIPIEEEAAAP
jgi:hypothetical protein